MERSIVVALSRPGARIQRFTVCRPRGTTRCRLCGKQVSLTVGPGGSRIPVNPDPDENGLYTAHFLTCSGAHSRTAARRGGKRSRTQVRP